MKRGKLFHTEIYNLVLRILLYTVLSGFFLKPKGEYTNTQVENFSCEVLFPVIPFCIIYFYNLTF